MRIKIDGTFYALDDAIRRPKINDVKHLARASRSKEFPAVTPSTLQAFFLDLAQVSAKSSAEVTDWLQQDDVLANVQGIMFLARRKAGEDITYEQAGDVSLADFSFESDEDDEEVEADPKDVAAAE